MLPSEELAGLLDVFRIMSSLGQLSLTWCAAVEELVFPEALSKRRLIRHAVGLALALPEPHRLLLTSLAVLQDKAFSRTSTDVNRACDYIRLIGVLARENAAFVAQHIVQQYSELKEDR
ncbi:unnamed protein product [Discosporangium mesarthrocarpum]